MIRQEQPPLHAGYLRQTESIDFSQLSATVLHIQAVIQGLEAHDYQLQIVTLHQGIPSWSDDRQKW